MKMRKNFVSVLAVLLVLLLTVGSFGAAFAETPAITKPLGELTQEDIDYLRSLLVTEEGPLMGEELLAHINGFSGEELYWTLAAVSDEQYASLQEILSEDELIALFAPLQWLLSKTADLLSRLFGVDPDAMDDNVTEEEIRLLVDVGEEKGVIEEAQKEMINNIFEFDDRTVVEVMTHRTDMFAVENDTDLDQFLTVAIQSGHSRIPVYNQSVDDIVGILYVKDLLPLLQMDDRSSFDIQAAMRKPLFVPESTRCDDLFRQFTAKKLHMAVVADEYGGTAGIVTMEDLVESILGSIQDEYDHEEEEAEQLSEDLFVLDGSLTLDETERLLDIELTDDTDYETIGGLLVERLDCIPAPDQHPEVELSGFRFRVEESDERRIIRITAQRLTEEETQD